MNERNGYDEGTWNEAKELFQEGWEADADELQKQNPEMTRDEAMAQALLNWFCAQSGWLEYQIAKDV